MDGESMGEDRNGIIMIDHASWFKWRFFFRMDVNGIILTIDLYSCLLYYTTLC